MKKKTVAPEFGMSLPQFYMMVRAKLSFIRRDSTEFVKYGVTNEVVTALETQTDEYAAIPPDDDLLGQQVITTQKKDAEADKLRDASGKILNRVENRFGRYSGVFRRFGVSGLSDQVDMQLYLTASHILRLAKIYLTELTGEGLTAAILTEYETLIQDYHSAVIEQIDAMAMRDLATEDRTTKANLLYHQIAKHCETGKQIWGSVNEAKYNDYIIYDNPPVKPEEGPKPV